MPNMNTVNMGQEEWRPVVGYDGLYEVSNYGNVRTATATRCKVKHQLLKQSLMNGYPAVGLRKDSKTRSFSVHRLVALAFIPVPDYKVEVNHKDLNRENNLVSNLEWITHSENIKHGMKFGRKEIDVYKSFAAYNKFRKKAKAA